MPDVPSVVFVAAVSVAVVDGGTMVVDVATLKSARSRYENIV
jgi:ribonuclease PH